MHQLACRHVNPELLSLIPRLTWEPGNEAKNYPDDGALPRHSRVVSTLYMSLTQVPCTQAWITMFALSFPQKYEILPKEGEEGNWERSHNSLELWSHDSLSLMFDATYYRSLCLIPWPHPAFRCLFVCMWGELRNRSLVLPHKLMTNSIPRYIV